MADFAGPRLFEALVVITNLVAAAIWLKAGRAGIVDNIDTLFDQLQAQTRINAKAANWQGIGAIAAAIAFGIGLFTGGKG
jgi:hypothetical protein